MNDRKRELKQAYKEIETQAGVYQIRNTVNGKILVVATPNLKTMTSMQFQLKLGSYHHNAQLQSEFKQFGGDAFEFEVLETVDEKIEGDLLRQEALKQLEQKWLEELQPYGDRGYNRG